MNYFVAICVLALAASARSSGLGGLGEGLVYAPGHASVDYYSYPKYAFDYAVKDPHTGDNKAQWEKRDGDVVKGAYSLVEPDGSLRVVEYWADDKSGFHADVKRIGPSVHPTPVKYEPIYKAPIPILKEHLGISPLSIGPIAGINKLSEAPLYGGYGVSSVSLVKEDIPIVKEIAPLPIIKPIIKPYISEPIYKRPILESYPLLKEPLLLREPLLHKEPLLLKEPLLYKAPYLAQEPYLVRSPLSYVKEPLGPYPLDIIGKVPLGLQGGLLPYGLEGGHEPHYSNKYI